MTALVCMLYNITQNCLLINARYSDVTVTVTVTLNMKDLYYLFILMTQDIPAGRSCYHRLYSITKVQTWLLYCRCFSIQHIDNERVEVYTWFYCHS